MRAKMLVSFANPLGLETIARLLKTRHFRTQLLPDVFNVKRDSGSTQPIFKIKADSVREKVYLSFAARRFLKRSVNFQKFSFENGVHTKKSPFLLYFQVQRDNAYSYLIFFILGSICRYIIHLQKAARRFLGFGFWKAGKQVLSAHPDQFEPFLLLL